MDAPGQVVDGVVHDQSLPPGPYTHYKGKHYEVLYVRPLGIFVETVQVGEVEVPRFARVDQGQPVGGC